MSKALLALYFTFVTLVSPALCCCTFRSLATNDEAVQEAGCCCCQEKSSPTAPTDQAPKKHECPCRAEGQPVATVAKSVTTIADMPMSIVGMIDLPNAIDFTSVAIERVAAPAPLDLRIRLSLLSTLRC